MLPKKKEKPKNPRVKRNPVDEVSFWMDYGLPKLFVTMYKSRKDRKIIICINKTANRGRPLRLTDDYFPIMPEFIIPKLIDTGVKEIIPR